MGYQAEKNKVEEQEKRVKNVVLYVLVAVLLGLCIFSAFVLPETWKYGVATPKVGKRKEGEMRIHFLDVGQGDATIIELPDGKIAMIDGGDGRESTKTTVLRYLNALKIDTIDYLVVTHADADHCGSLDGVLNYKNVLNAYLPTVSPEKSCQEYAEFYAKLLEKDCEMQYSARKIILNNDTGKYPYVFSFLYPYSLYANENETGNATTDSNALSSVLWLDYRGTSALFTGDAPFDTEDILIADDGLNMFDARGVELSSTEILKVAHHGSEKSTGLSFLKYLNVETAVISCGQNNAYGHPTQRVLQNLAEVDAKVYRTDLRGTVTITVKETGEYTVSTYA